MELPTTSIGIFSILCCFVLPIVVTVAWWFIVPTPDGILSWMFWKSIKAEKVEEKNYRNDLMQRGVTAPAKILSIRALGHRQKLSGSPYKSLVEYDVEVMPEGQPSFQARFQYWLPLSWKNGTGEAIRQEREANIWVTYDPNDPSQIIYDHNDKDHAQVFFTKQMVKKRNHFIDMEKEGIRIREIGVETLAIILELEELGIETQEEKRDGRSFRLKLNVMPQDGANFESETYAMVSLDTMHKLRVGNMVHVKYDPFNLEICALIRAAG